MNKETTQNENARALARQAVTDLCAAWETVQNSLVYTPTARLKQKFPIDYDDQSLMDVIIYGDIPALETLIVQGANIHANKQDLRRAVSNKQYEMVRFLLDHHVDVHSDDDAALKAGIEVKDFEIVDLLVNRGAFTSELSPEFYAVYKAHKTEQKEQHEKRALIQREWRADKNIATVFNAKTWAGHTNEMTVLWDKIPEPLKNGIDFPHLVAEAQHEYSRQNKPKKPVFIR
jgi:hypothetical protein